MTASETAMSMGFLKYASTTCSNFNPRTPAGIVARTMNHTNRPSPVFHVPSPMPAKNLRKRSSQSFQKYARIETRVPACKATSKFRLSIRVPFQPNIQGIRIRWAEELIGKNSVNPWTMPNRIASKRTIYQKPPLLNLRLQVHCGHYFTKDPGIQVVLSTGEENSMGAAT
jgi:hypothetical protein